MVSSTLHCRVQILPRVRFSAYSHMDHMDLYITGNGLLIPERYRNDNFGPIVVPYAGAVGDNFILMGDNARPHRARLVQTSLGDEGAARIDWPACSADVNPIEHVWYMLGRRITTRQMPPTTMRDLETSLLQEWQSIPQEVEDSFISSTPRRCAACLAVAGDHLISVTILHAKPRNVEAT